MHIRLSPQCLLQDMDPIECAVVNGSDYCWVQGNAGEKGTESAYLGAYLFPIIQHYDKARAAT